MSPEINKRKHEGRHTAFMAFFELVDRQRHVMMGENLTSWNILRENSLTANWRLEK